MHHTSLEIVSTDIYSHTGSSTLDQFVRYSHIPDPACQQGKIYAQHMFITCQSLISHPTCPRKPHNDAPVHGQPQVYRAIIDEVMANIKSEFEEFGVDEDVMAQLQNVRLFPPK
ncbi:TFIIA domain-containing protein [Rhizoctonia solani AG-1 IA]|uniref:TFIIA domain-containing protein n=1 Tax=Thanatephorus cucumeris (strain AG1-IA) TaxID=983506 RepID=L8WCI1_THACA|nr:TFIIA domain-containing protein [Rhizoctonia solani AG-1 IA]